MMMLRGWWRLSWGRVVILLVVMLALLQLLHMTLLSRLEARNANVKHTRLLQSLQQYTKRLHQSMREAVQESQIVDSSGTYRIINFLYGNAGSIENNNFKSQTVIPENYNVTLVTQCSVSHIHHLIDLSKRWQGPMSVAVFAPGNQVAIVIEMMLALYRCVPSVRKNLTMHVVYPFLPTTPKLSTQPFQSEYSCDKLKDILQKKTANHRNYAMAGIKYPNNLLRNVALRNARTDYVFVVDIDMLPSGGLHRHFVDYIRRHSIDHTLETIANQTVFVVPSFEIQKEVPIPRYKSELLDLWDKQQVRPFYQELCWRCQHPTNYERWQKLSTEDDKLEIAYPVEWKDPWEPFYIAPASMPPYDERFKQYGFNRISQACELHVAGYRFGILNNAFLVHKGFKTPDDFHLTKDGEQEENRSLFRQLKEELKTKYPDSSRRCY